VQVVELDGDRGEEEVEEKEVEEGVEDEAAKRRKNAAYEWERIARQPVQRCGVDGCESQTKQKSYLEKHQALVHGIWDVDAEKLRRKERERKQEHRARQPAQRCGFDGCEFQAKLKYRLKEHQACVHGIGDLDAEELRRKKREDQARLPLQRCGIDGCEHQTKYTHVRQRHQARVHGIGDVEAKELRRKAREWQVVQQARQPAKRCGVDGCEYQTKFKSDLKKHQARVHGIGDVDAEELRRKQRERISRQPVQRCGVDGCEYETNRKSHLKTHRACVHGIGDVDVEELRRKARERDRKRRRSVETYSDTDNDADDEVVAAAPRSRRARSAVDYAALAGGDSDDDYVLYV
jgi:hypothetical protein